MKTMRNLLLGAAVIIVLSILLIALAPGDNNVKDFTNRNAGLPNNPGNPPENIKQTSPPSIPLNSIKKVGEPVVQDDFTYTVSSANITKTLNNIKLEDFAITPIVGKEIDDNGTLICDRSYVYLSITIKNNLSEGRESNIAPFLQYHEPWYRNIVVFKGRDYWKYNFKGNEEENFIYVYVIPDKYLNENLLLRLFDWPHYDSNYDGDQYYIEIKK